MKGIASTLQKTVALLLGLMMIMDQAASNTSGQYGDPCDENDFNGCSLNAALSCVSSTCGCVYPWMVYDPLRAKCVSTVSNPCDIDPSVQFLDCVSDSHCALGKNEFGQPFPQCLCNENYSPKAKTTCADQVEQVSYYGEQLSQICCPSS